MARCLDPPAPPTPFLCISSRFLALLPSLPPFWAFSLYVGTVLCVLGFWYLGFCLRPSDFGWLLNTLTCLIQKKHVATSLPLLLGSNPHVPRKLFWGWGVYQSWMFYQFYQFMHASLAHAGQSRVWSWPHSSWFSRRTLSLLQWLFVRILLKCVSAIIWLALIESEPPPVSKRKYQTCLTVLIPRRPASPTIAPTRTCLLRLLYRPLSLVFTHILFLIF